jgi:hypothetical protein
MTPTDAEAIQAEWKIYRKLDTEVSPCAHVSRELGYSHEGYLIGVLYCRDCGKAFNLLPSFHVAGRPFQTIRPAA